LNFDIVSDLEFVSYFVLLVLAPLETVELFC